MGPAVLRRGDRVVLAGCSSDPPDYQPPAGELVAGTAQVTVNGHDARSAEAAAAEVRMTGRTYDISGTADGFKTDSPSFRASGAFNIRVSC